MTMRGQVAAAALLLWALLSGGCGDAVPGNSARNVTPCVAVAVDPDLRSGRGTRCVPLWDADDGWEPETLTTTGSVVDAAGVPVEHLWLRFWRHGDSKNVEAGANGAFEVRLPEGPDYDVDAFLGAAEPWALGAGRRVHLGTVTPGERQVALRVPETQVLLASGVLVDRIGAALPGWTVEVSRVDDAGREAYVPSVTTDADGRYRVFSWNQGRIRVKHGYGPEGQTWRIAQSSTDETTGETRHELRPAIAGKVIVDDGGTPAGATVRLWRNSGILDRCVTVDGSGAFDFDDTYPGADYEIGAELSGYAAIERRACVYDALDVSLWLVGPSQQMQGRLVNSSGEPIAYAWIRFVPVDARSPVQSKTGADGAFRSVEVRDVEYEAFVLVPSDDGRSVPGPKVGRCRGGETYVLLRTPR